MRPKFFHLYIIIFLIIPSPSHFSQNIFQSEPSLRVRIIYTLDSLEMIFNNEWELVNEDENIKYNFSKDDSAKLEILNNQINLIEIRNSSTVSSHKIKLISKEKDGTIKIKRVPYGIGWWWEGIEDRVYEGEIEISINGNIKFDVIIALPLEKYLCGVVPYEIGSDAPLEALKSQVIAARSETMEALISEKYKEDNYDICADVECQVFAGNNKRTELTDKAVEDTRGLCLFYVDKVIGAYYASNCGGMSENVEDVWPERSSPEPYWNSHFDSDSELNFNPKENPKEWIEGNPDVFCNPDYHPELPDWGKKNFRWQVEMTNDELSKNLNEIKNIGNLIAIEIMERGNSGRITKAKFIGDVDSLLLNSELDIRKIKKPPFRSSCFIVEKQIEEQNKQAFIFKGAGWGHGVGMCQSGAVARAYSGQNFIEILNHYFPKTEIKKAY